MISSMIRSTMNTAFRRPSAEIRTTPHWTSVWPPGVKNRFSTPVKIRMNTTGFNPRTRDLSPTLEIADAHRQHQG